MANSGDDKPAKNHPLANLTPEQMRALLAADIRTTARAPSQEQARESSRRRLVWAGVILCAGLFYVIFKISTSPAKVILINSSGEDAASVIIVSGTQRVDLGTLANGEVRTVELLSGQPLQIEYRFEDRRVWHDAEPLGPFQSLTVFLTIGHKVQVVRERPWARTATR